MECSSSDKNRYHALLKASSMLYSVFPSGENNLTSEQNIALNAFLDAVYELKNNDRDFAMMVIEDTNRSHEHSMDELEKNGIIDKKYRNSITMFNVDVQCLNYCRSCQYGKVGRLFCEPDFTDFKNVDSECSKCAVRRKINEISSCNKKKNMI